jgi:hypothetical protein
MATRKTFPDHLPRAQKSKRGRTDVTSTPLAIRSRVPLSDATRERIRTLLGRKLAKFATHIEQGTVRIDDVNGPRGGFDTLCKIKIVVSGSPSIVVEERGVAVEEVVAVAARVVARAVRREVERRGRSSPKSRKRSERDRKAAGGTVPGPTDEGSLIGRRVGRSRDQLERALARPEKQRRDAYVDTSAASTSASDRKVGYGATARRNTKRNTKGLTSALEDSRTTPSRKSTRKSGNRARAAAPLEIREALRRAAPKAAAARARAARRGKRPR